MKTNNFILWAVFVIALCITSICIGYSVRGVESNNGYNQNDSIARDSLLNRIDTINVYETIVKERIRTIRETDTVYYNGTDTACIAIIDRKNRLIAGQDTLIELLDLECREYSELNLIEIKRNKQLSSKLDSTIVLYTDSLTAQRKISDKAIKKEKTKTFLYKVTTTVACVLGIYGTMTK